MQRRQLLLGGLAAAGLLPAVPAMADIIPLDRISDYFNALSTARASFTQINADGTISTGTLYIHRPGRMRFEYNPPDNALVIAGSGSVAIFDGKSNERRPEQYPLRRTPLQLILEERVDLSRRDMVIAHVEDGPKTIVVAQDPEHPEYGNLQLIFTAPVELRQWIVTDDLGTRTTVVLGDLELGVDLGSRLFNVRYEIDRRGG